MKFTEEQAREALRSKLTNNGRKTLHMSERTLQSLTEKLIKALADEEVGLPDFVDSAIEILEITEGDARKKNSDFAKYKESHPDVDPEPKDEPKSEQKTEANPEVAALMAKLEAFEKKYEESEKLSKLSAKKSDLINALNAKGIKDTEWLNTFLSEVSITEDMDVEAKAESYAKLYNKSHANVPPVPTPGAPSVGNGSDIPAALKAAAELAKAERETAKFSDIKIN